jgi:hypothetical protein
MLTTTWAAFGVGEQFQIPSHPSHYFIYWVGPCLAAILAGTAYVIYAGGTVFGITLPTGTLKKKKVGGAGSSTAICNPTFFLAFYVTYCISYVRATYGHRHVIILHTPLSLSPANLNFPIPLTITLTS